MKPQPDNENVVVAPEQLEEYMALIDRIMLNFSDGASCTRSSGRSSLWNKKSQLPTMAQISQVYAPTNLKAQFEQVYRALHPCLVQRRNENTTTSALTSIRTTQQNASVFLQGSRGSGKTLLLNQCLEAFQDELQQSNNEKTTKPRFRIVKVNGCVVPGHHVGIVVRDMLQQLSTAAFQETAGKSPRRRRSMDESSSSSSPCHNKRARKNNKNNYSKSDHRMEQLLRLRHTSFTNNIQLLNEILHLASVDDIPVLIVLDELDAFVSPRQQSSSSLVEDVVTSESATHNSRQLLLYHILDRVAQEGSYLAFVGMTAHAGILGMLEKRIKSRAEGTSRFVHVGPPQSFQALGDILLDKFHDAHGAVDDADVPSLASLRQQVAKLFQQQNSIEDENENEQTDDLDRRRVHDSLERSHRLGNNVRWFCRVFSLSLALHREDCRRHVCHGHQKKKSPKDDRAAVGHDTIDRFAFKATHISEALVDMGAPILTESGERELALDIRLQALKDLSGPQVAILLAARRILTRDSHREGDSAVPLTLERILEEYRSYKGNLKYSKHVLRRAFDDLLQMDVLRPSTDHSGTGPFQYDHDVSIYNALDLNTLERMPLHLTYDANREVRMALEKNMLHCSTALREWGRKIN